MGFASSLSMVLVYPNIFFDTLIRDARMLGRTLYKVGWKKASEFGHDVDKWLVPGQTGGHCRAACERD